jgi:hypothetical protein
MPLLQRHLRREGGLPWHRLWSARGASVEIEGSGFLAERRVTEFWSQNTALKTLDELDSALCILALGDPALGKSWELGNYTKRISDQIAASSVGGTSPGEASILLAFDATEFESAEMLETKVFGSPLSDWRGGTGVAYVIIDSLDEASVSLDTLCHAILDKLDDLPVERLRLRIACRTAVVPNFFRAGLRRRFSSLKKTDPEPGRSDASLSRSEVGGQDRVIPGEETDDDVQSQDVVPEGPTDHEPVSPDRYVEVEIAVLTRVEARIAALDRLGSSEGADRFLDAVEQADAESFAARPQQLMALVGRFSARESLAASQRDLFRSLCMSMADPNPVQPHAIHTQPRLTSREERYHLAARISAAMLLGNRSTLWFGSHSHTKEGSLDITAVTGAEWINDRSMRVTETELWEAVNTSLFTAGTDEEGLAAHLTFAEFLTAEWLARVVKPYPQIKALLTDPNDVDRHILPQLRQVAAWLAAMRQDVFDAVALAEPDIMLWSDVVQLDELQRPALVDALLQGTTKNTILNPPFGMRDRLGRLSHPDLANQLAPFITNNKLPERTRELAVDVARSNHLQSLSSLAAGIALDETESIDFRALAARLVADVGTDSDRLALLALVQNPPIGDVADELKGAALRACWKLLEPPQLFPLLTHPKRSNFGGIYSFTLREIAEGLDTTYALAGAQWLREDHHGSLTALDDIAKAALSLSISAFDQPGILSALADYAMHRFHRHEPLLDRHPRRNTESADIGAQIEGNLALRRGWVTHIVNQYPDNNRELFHLSHDAPRLFNAADVEWAIGELTALPTVDPRRKSWSELLKWSFDYSDDNVATVLRHRSDATITELFPNLLPYQSADDAVAAIRAQRKKWDRDIARKQKRRALAVAKREAATQPVPAGSLSTRLEERMAGIADPERRWIRIAQEILRINAKQIALFLEASRLAELRSLKDTAVGDQVTEAARSYLESVEVSDDPFPNGGTRYEVIFGFLAAVTLLELKPDTLQQLSDGAWNKWMRALLGHYTDEVEAPLQLALISLAVNKAPNTAKSEFVRLLDGDAKNRRGWIRDPLLEIALQVPGVEEEIASRTAAGRYGTDATENMLEQLLKRGSAHAEEAALQIFRNPVIGDIEASGGSASTDDTQPRRFAAAAALFFKAPSVIWPDLWSLLSSDDVTAKAFFTFAARRRDFIATSALDTLSAKQLSDLYLLLARLYPPETDPWHVGAFSPGPRDNLQHLRSSLLNALEARKTVDSVVALENIARAEPVRDYLVQLWLRAKAAIHGERWHGLEPQDLMRLAEHQDLRIVESSTQLLDVVCESLVKLQDELQGELRSVVGLWNEANGGNDPKSEEHLSNEIARHLKRDLADRRVVIGRELRIQIGIPGAAGGLRTDIDVQAPAMRSGRASGEVPRVIIEVKGSWNPQVKTAMRDQLVRTYLEPHKVSGGLYVVGHYTCNSWVTGRRYKQSVACGARSELQAALAQQATELTSAIREVRAIVLDTSLPNGGRTKPQAVRRRKPASRHGSRRPRKNAMTVTHRPRKRQDTKKRGRRKRTRRSTPQRRTR